MLAALLGLGARNSRSQPAIDALEPRQFLDGTLPFAQYFPEGYASDSINEYVPITNTNSQAVQYELWAKYEVGGRDQLLLSGSIPANTRGGYTVCDIAHPEDTAVRKNEPYALVLKSTLPLAATMSHYDFGTAVGETFTSRTDTEWTFGDGRKDANLTRDYILVYNPGPAAADVTITLYAPTGQTTTDFRHVEAERRSGWSIQDIPSQPDGVFAVKITSTVAIVASQSHYELQEQRGYGLLGTPGAGALAGVVPAINFDDHFYDTNGDDPRPGVGRFTANAYLSILNAGDAPAIVTLTFIGDNPGPGDPVQVGKATVVQAGTRATLSIRDLTLGFSDSTEFGVVYRSNVPVTVTASVYQGQDGTGVDAEIFAATEWRFGEGYMSRSRAGAQIQEHIYVFNPGASEVEVTFQFMMTTGQVVSVTKRVDARSLEDVKVHRLNEVLDIAEDQWYGVLVTSATPIVASMEHWDGGIGGGFSTFGEPGGTVVDFASVLTL